MAGTVQDVGNSTTIRGYAEDNKRHRAVHNMHQDNKEKEVVTQDFDMVRSEVFKAPDQ